MNFEQIHKLQTMYIEYRKTIKEINNTLKCKKIRNPNFPSEISENIVRLYLNKNGSSCIWSKNGGDLLCLKNNIKIEVKAFTSSGPTSFGPKESWKELYVLDCTQFENNIFILYQIKLSNKSKKFRSIKFTKTKTFGEIADNGKRPRCCFNKIKQQLGNDCVFLKKFNLSYLKE